MNRRSAVCGVLMLAVVASAATTVSAQEPACRTGGVVAADAYILSNPLYGLFFGDLRAYVAENAAHFRAGGDGTRCLAALSQVLLGAAAQLYDPGEWRRRSELNARLGSLGIAPGPATPSASTEAYNASMRLGRLARALPAAAEGDWAPYDTPANELEQMQVQAEQLLRIVLQDPDVAAMIAQMEPAIRQLAALEHGALQRQAALLAAPRR